MSKLSILLDDQVQFEYDRDFPPDQTQVDFLNNMDKGMDASGIIIDQEKIQAPTQEQKLEFVATNLFNALGAKSGSMIGSMTTYLAIKSPKLKQVLFFQQEDGEMTKKMVYDET